MMSSLSPSDWAVFGSVFAVFFALVATVISLSGGRRSRYDAELQAIKLDATRQSIEADIKAMYESLYRDKSRWNEMNHLLLDSVRRIEHSKEQVSTSQIDPSRFLSSLGINRDELSIDQRSVFILTPMNEEEHKTSNIIKFACSEIGLHAIRGDEENISGPILPSIIRAILRARVVVANINGRNPNVMYELGIAQALGKDVILVSQKVADEIPFDVRQQRLVLYSDFKDLSSKIKIAISQIGLGLSLNN